MASSLVAGNAADVNARHAPLRNDRCRMAHMLRYPSCRRAFSADARLTVRSAARCRHIQMQWTAKVPSRRFYAIEALIVDRGTINHDRSPGAAEVEPRWYACTTWVAPTRGSGPE